MGRSFNALKDLPTGDMPQTSLNIGLSASPVEGSAVQLTYRWYDRFYSDWSATSREFSDGESPDRKHPWLTPSYGIVDLNAFRSTIP